MADDACDDCIVIRTTRDRAYALRRGVVYLIGRHDALVTDNGQTAFTRYAHEQCQRLLEAVLDDIDVALDRQPEEKPEAEVSQ